MKRNELRVIKVEKDALFELINETIVENARLFFDLSKSDEVTILGDVDFSAGTLVCAACKRPIPKNTIDITKIGDMIPVTTQSFFVPNRFITMIMDRETGEVSLPGTGNDSLSHEAEK